MHHAAKEVVATSIALPFVVNDLRQGISLENFNFFSFCTELHQVDILVSLLTIFGDVKIDLWKQINAIFDLDDF